MRLCRLYIVLFVACFAQTVSAQEYGHTDFYLIDSVDLNSLDSSDIKLLDKQLTIWHSDQDDSVRFAAIGELIDGFRSRVWIRYNNWWLHELQDYMHEIRNESESTKNRFRPLLASALNNEGFAAGREGDPYRAIDYYMAAEKMFAQAGDRQGMAVCYVNSALAYRQLGDIETSNEMERNALEIAKSIDNMELVSLSYHNIAMKLMMSGLNEEALENASLSLKHALLVNDNPIPEGRSSMGVAQIYGRLEKDSLSETYFKVALDIYSKHATMNQYTAALLAYAEAQRDQMRRARGDELRFNELADSTEKVLFLTVSLCNRHGLGLQKVRAFTNLARVFNDQGRYRDALVYADSAYLIISDMNNMPKLMRVVDVRYEVLKNLNRPSEALEMLEQYVTISRQLDDNHSVQMATQHKLKLEHDLKIARDSARHQAESALYEKDIQLQQSKIDSDRRQKWFLIVGLLLIALFGLFMYNRFKVTRKQKGVIEEQKHEIEEAHDDIKASINYAKRLQSAILPSANDINEKLGENFVLFRPKDVVSGDFYWLQERDGIVLFAAADCTGHGVPGAMVSVVCSNTLNRCVKEFGITDPAEILNKTRDLVIEAFGVSGQEVKDGMDISICAFDTKSRTLKFAGANNPLWVARKASSVNGQEKVYTLGDFSIIEYKGDKQPVGLYDEMVPFTTHDVQIESGDRIYLFSDGYADQFGGEKGKKMKYKTMKERIMVSLDETISAQQDYLYDYFDEWRGEHEQIDDVCVIGVQIS